MKNKLIGSFFFMVAIVSLVVPSCDALSSAGNRFPAQGLCSAEPVILLSEGFENTTMPPPLWTRSSFNQDATWSLTTLSAHTGVTAARVPGDTEMQDERLSTPPLNLTIYQYANVEFWTKATTLGNDTVQLLVNDDVLWDKNQEETWGPFYWRDISLDLSAYRGTTIVITWRYIGENGYAFYLDDVTVTASETLYLTHGGPYTGYNDVPIQFNGSAHGGQPPYTYLWDFGDGDTATIPDPSHTYTTPGMFNVTLQAQDSEGHSASVTTTAQVLEEYVTLMLPSGKGGILSVRNDASVPVTVFYISFIYGRTGPLSPLWMYSYKNGNFTVPPQTKETFALNLSSNSFDSFIQYVHVMVWTGAKAFERKGFILFHTVVLYLSGPRKV
jgi:PKD repeat protein